MDGFFSTWNGFDAHGLAYQVAREVFQIGELFIQAADWRDPLSPFTLD